MSMNHQARIEVEPPHARYPAWWMVPLTYQAVPATTAVIDCLWIVALSGLTGSAYHSVALNHKGELGDFIGAGIVVAALFSTAAHARGLYPTANLLRVKSQIGQALLIWVMIFLCFASVTFALKIGNMLSRGAILLFFISGIVAIIGLRIGLAALLRHVVASGLLSRRRVILLTDSKHLSNSQLAKPLELYGYALSRVFTIAAPHEHHADDQTIGEQIADVLRYVRQRRPDEIFLAIGWHKTALIRRLSHELRSVSVPARLLATPDVEWLLEHPLLDLGPARAVELQRAPLSAGQRALKRVLDVTLASAGLLVLLPVFAFMALAIRLDTPGSVLFQQGRTGFNGRVFRIYKFRTMTTLEDGPEVRQARRNDQRVTRVGRILRRFSLDELPQLLNVLRGDMSLVGPRPHALVHDDQYARLITEYAARHKVKPGITGWAQVNGCRGETPHVDMMKLRVDHDLWYINSWSVWLDIRILLRTVLQVLRDRNAY
jgi:Undecaprenyl-phosphate glucose phosphotransferase